MNKETLARVAGSKNVQIAGASVASFLLGGLITDRVVKNKWRKHYEAISDDEIDKARDHYAKINKTGDYSDPEILAAAYKTVEDAERAEFSKSVEELGYDTTSSATRPPVRTLPENVQRVLGEDHPLVKTHPDLAPVIDDGSQEATDLIAEGMELADVLEEAAEKTRNIFKENETDYEDSWDWDEESHKRENADPTVPYIITIDEFMSNENDWEQPDLVYYEGDEVLVDSREEPVTDIDQTVGDDNLSKFGHGSGDPKLLYVRNERLEAEYSIARHTGSYTEEVLGFHGAEDRNTRRRRTGDDG